jgi:hypothetical protein
VRRRDTGVRPKFIVATATAAAALLAALAGCSAAATSTSAKATAAAKVRTSPDNATRTAVPAKSMSPTATPTPKPKPTPSALPVGAANAGTLPQTSVLPKTNVAAFNNAVHDLWLAVATGNPDYARPAFFPEKAYEQVKAIAYPESDWQGRLWLDFTLDVAAVHKLIKPGATFTKVIAPTEDEQWIPTGACYNSTGYWHLPGSRLVYREGGVTHSFGIASFISWRGDWYVIHLGALVRGGAYGIVDDPETGEGFPGPAGGC